MLYVCNAFALSMLDRARQLAMPRAPRPISIDEARAVANEAANASRFMSVVGHADVAAIFTAALGVLVRPNRVSLQLAQHDMLLVGQFIGPRLPEGATALPPGATIEWWLV